MHAARALKLQRKKREGQRRVRLLSLTSSTDDNGSESFSATNTFYIERLEDRRKSIAVERERSRINLLHVGLILCLIGSVMILLGCFMKSAYACFEVGLVALLFGLYVTIGCGCQRSKKVTLEQEQQQSIGTFYTTEPHPESGTCNPSGNYEMQLGICNNGLDTSDQCIILNEISKCKKDSSARLIGIGYMLPTRIICSKPIFDQIPEESETTSLFDPENLSSDEEDGYESEDNSKMKMDNTYERNELIVRILTPTPPTEDSILPVHQANNTDSDFNEISQFQ